MRKRVGHVLFIPCVIGVDTHGAVELEGRKGFGHEGAVYRDLVQIHTDAVVLSVAVEEHAELEQWVGRVFNAGDHAAGGEGGLLDVAVEVFRVLVED